ncbi:hypothetical protein D3C75_879100 [compost metagenome]
MVGFALRCYGTLPKRKIGLLEAKSHYFACFLQACRLFLDQWFKFFTVFGADHREFSIAAGIPGGRPIGDHQHRADIHRRA